MGREADIPFEASAGPAQRKTTLKWDGDGELTSIDMVRSLDQLTAPELKRCRLDPS